MKYIKKPVIVDAEQWFKNGDHSEDNCKIFDAGEGPFQGEGKIVRYYRNPDDDENRPCQHCGNIMHLHGWIDTLEGGYIVCPGDWIVTGVRFEKYPVKPYIFPLIYELVED